MARLSGMGGRPHPAVCAVYRVGAVLGRLGRRPYGSAQGALLEPLLEAENTLQSLPEAQAAAAQFSNGSWSQAIDSQRRVVDVMEAVPDPALGLVAKRRLALLHGLRGDYDRELVLRGEVATAASCLDCCISSATKYEASVASLRAGQVGRALDEAAAAIDIIGASAPLVLRGWHGTVLSCESSTHSAGVDAIEAVAQDATGRSIAAEIWLHLGNAWQAASKLASARAAYERAVDVAGDAVALRSASW